MLRQSLIVLQVLVAAMADDAVLDDLQARRPRSLVEAAPESGVHGQQQALVEDLQSGDSCRQVLTGETHIDTILTWKYCVGMFMASCWRARWSSSACSGSSSFSRLMLSSRPDMTRCMCATNCGERSSAPLTRLKSDCDAGDFELRLKHANATHQAQHPIAMQVSG